MKIRQEYEQFINEKFAGQARELLLKNVKLYYQENIDVKKNKYKVGDSVFLKKGSFIHGLCGSPDSYNNFKIFDYVCENGFGGIMSWDLATDVDVTDDKSLLKVVKEEFDYYANPAVE